MTGLGSAELIETSKHIVDEFPSPNSSNHLSLQIAHSRVRTYTGWPSTGAIIHGVEERRRGPAFNSARSGGSTRASDTQIRPRGSGGGGFLDSDRLGCGRRARGRRRDRLGSAGRAPPGCRIRAGCISPMHFATPLAAKAVLEERLMHQARQALWGWPNARLYWGASHPCVGPNPLWAEPGHPWLHAGHTHWTRAAPRRERRRGTREREHLPLAVSMQPHAHATRLQPEVGDSRARAPVAGSSGGWLAPLPGASTSVYRVTSDLLLSSRSPADRGRRGDRCDPGGRGHAALRWAGPCACLRRCCGSGAASARRKPAAPRSERHAARGRRFYGSCMLPPEV